MPTLSRLSNLELLKLPDCGGLQENGRCSWLNVSLCIGTNCPYCGAKNSLKKAYARLRSLDEKVHISHKSTMAAGDPGLRQMKFFEDDVTCTKLAS